MDSCRHRRVRYSTSSSRTRRSHTSELVPSWDKVQGVIRNSGAVYDQARRGYLVDYSKYTGRNAILHYSGWIEKSHLLARGLTGYSVSDEDKNGFMATVHGLDRSKGLDLILATPGGDIATTESIVGYLVSFG